MCTNSWRVNCRSARRVSERKELGCSIGNKSCTTVSCQWSAHNIMLLALLYSWIFCCVLPWYCGALASHARIHRQEAMLQCTPRIHASAPLCSWLIAFLPSFWWWLTVPASSAWLERHDEELGAFVACAGNTVVRRPPAGTWNSQYYQSTHRMML